LNWFCDLFRLEHQRWWRHSCQTRRWCYCCKQLSFN